MRGSASTRVLLRTALCLSVLVTLGLVALVVNGLLFLLTSWIAGVVGLPFHVQGFLTAVLGALIVGVISRVINAVVPDKLK